MGIAGTLFLVIFAITTVLIITLVMLQDEQGEGFGGLFGGSGNAAPFGAVGGNILARATTILGVLFMVSSLAVAMVYKSGKEDKIIQESHKAAGSGENWFLVEPESEATEETGAKATAGESATTGETSSAGKDATPAEVVPVGTVKTATAGETTGTSEAAEAGEPASPVASPTDESATDNSNGSTMSETTEQ